MWFVCVRESVYVVGETQTFALCASPHLPGHICSDGQFHANGLSPYMVVGTAQRRFVIDKYSWGREGRTSCGMDIDEFETWIH